MYDSYTCWEPGGIVIRYPYRYGNQISIDATIERTDGAVTIKRIGRSYAVAHPDPDAEF